MHKIAFTTAAALMGVTAATAQVASVGNARSSLPGAGIKDPNRVICVTETQTGSRLGGTRECRTVAEWAEARRMMREQVGRIQDMKMSNDATAAMLSGMTTNPGLRNPQ